MAVPTRVTHQVRIKKPHDEKSYAIDIEVLDAIIMLGTDGIEYLYCFLCGNPNIIDLTGDEIEDLGGGGAAVDRVSHFVRYTSDVDDHNYIDLEILDAFTVLGTDAVEDGYALVSNTLGICIDKTGLGLAKQEGSPPSRVTHIVKVGELKKGPKDDPDGVKTRSVNNDDSPDDLTNMGDDNFTATAKTDAVCLIGTGGVERLMVSPYFEKMPKIDATAWTEDEDGNKAPPENKDRNKYVHWPKDRFGGPWLDKTPKNEFSQKNEVPNLGPLWWVKRVIAKPRPWYWWVPKQQPLEFSFYGDPPQDIVEQGRAWAQRGFVLEDHLSVVAILGPPFYGTDQLDPFGYKSLEDACDAVHDQFWLCDFTDAYADGGGEPPSLQIIIDFSAMGILPMMQWPVTDDGKKSIPNIWQLTGIDQPWDKKRDRPGQPTQDQADEVANKFGDSWRVTQQSALGFAHQCEGEHGDTFVPARPLMWAWSTQYWSIQDPTHRGLDVNSISGGKKDKKGNYAGGGTYNGSAFQSGICEGQFGFAPKPLLDLHYPTPTRIEVGQLDPKEWDTSVFPPERWSWKK